MKKSLMDSATDKKEGVYMNELVITVKPYMTKEATPEFDFMAKWNNNVPMPLRTMVGTVERETRGMVYMKLHGEIIQRLTERCMKCGKPITHPVSKYFGMGVQCGGHNYINPFETEEELNNAIASYREKLRTITWEGWVIKSAIMENYQFSHDGEEEVLEEVAPKIPNITIRIDKSKKVYTKQALFISFDYDTEILGMIKALDERRWNPDDKEWEVPTTEYDNLMNKFSKYNVTVTGELEREAEISHSADVPEEFEFKTKPFDHQHDGFIYGLEHDRWLLGDEQGLGKTKQVIDIAVAKKLQKNYKHCLIICGVNGLKWNWKNEIATHSNESGHILGEKKNGKISSNADKLADLKNIKDIDDYFLITNVESLRSGDIAEAIAKLCKNGTIGIVAVDEIHKAKNHSSQQGKGLLKIKPECRIAMTGTPLMNNPLDLYIILKWLGYENHSFYNFKNHYCVMGGFGGYEIVAYRNLEELQTQLNNIMLRRLKDDVLDLPEKLMVNEYVEMLPKQAQIYKEVTMAIKADIDRIKCASNPLAELIRMRQATGCTGILSSTINESAKLDRMEELVDELTANGRKVVVFSNWTQMTDEIFNRLAKSHVPAIITGDTKDDERMRMVNQFQNGDADVIIGTIGAMGTGLTLTAGSAVIFMDEPWTMANKQQAIDRCHRIGTTENVTVYTIMCKDTIDERIHELVEKKGAMSDAIIDGKALTREETLEYLLG